MNDAALAAARLRSERLLHPPLWLRALCVVLPLPCTLLFTSAERASAPGQERRPRAPLSGNRE